MPSFRQGFRVSYYLLIQEKKYSDEISGLQKGENMKKSSHLSRLILKLMDGILRVGLGLVERLYQRGQGIRFYWLGIFTLLTLCFNMYIKKHGRVDIITCFLSFSKAFCFQVQVLLQYKEDFS